MSKSNEGSIRRRADGMWEGRYTDGVNEKGKQIQRSVYGKTKQEVADKIHTILYQKQQGIYVMPQKVLVKDWMEQWLHNYALITVRESAGVLKKIDYIWRRENKQQQHFDSSIKNKT